MHAWEPDLLERLADRIPGFLGFGRFVPQRGQELLASVIDRQRMKGIPHVRVQVVIVEAVRPQAQLPILVAERDAEGADRVPDPDEVRGARSRVAMLGIGVCFSESFRRRKPRFAPSLALTGAGLVDGVCLGDEVASSRIVMS